MSNVVYPAKRLAPIHGFPVYQRGGSQPGDFVAENAVKDEELERPNLAALTLAIESYWIEYPE